MDHIADLHRDGRALLDAARAAGLDAPVAACPGWDVSRLVGHTGKVLERTTILVREGLDAPPDNDRFVRFPADESAFDRFAAVLDDTVAALADCDPDGSSWNFTGADLTNGFWRRRMANEVAVHRDDAELAAGAPQPVEAERAVDAIDELVMVMLPFSAALKNPELTGSFHLHCTDTEGEWLAVFTDGAPGHHPRARQGRPRRAGPGLDAAALGLQPGPAGAEGLESFGDPALLDGWASIVP